MTQKTLTNLSASVRQRLLTRACATGRPFEQVLKYYSMKRFLYRLSCSPHADAFVLKGALMLQVWQGPEARRTEDIDLLGRVRNEPELLADIVRSVCSQEVVPDGLVFHTETVSAVAMQFDPRYSGVRLSLRAALGTACVSLRLDVGFGDAVIPGPSRVVYPAILDFPAPEMHGYSRESAIAEKFQAMVQHGEFNSRLKDFFDIWLLSQRTAFAGEVLAEAIRETFRHHRQEVSASPHAFDDPFALDPGRCAQWRRYVREYHLPEDTPEFPAVVSSLARFLAPPAVALASGRPFTSRWPASGPWQEATS